MRTLTRRTPFLPSILAATALLTLVACTGGGGGDKGGSTSAPAGGGSGPAAPSCPLPTGLNAKVQTALATGNALTGATADEFLDATLTTLEAQRTGGDPLLKALYNLNADGTAKADGSSLTGVNWDPSHDAALFTATFGVNTEVLVSNQTTAGAPAPAKGLAVAGQAASGSRYLVMASNPFRTTRNAQMDAFMVNGLRWLTGKAAGTPLKVAIVHLDESYWFKDESTTRTWLTSQWGAGATFNAANAYDGPNLNKVLTDGADLVIVSQQLDAGQTADQVRDGIKALMDAGKPVLYLQLDGGPNALGTQLYDLFQVQYAGDNYWSNYQTVGLDGRTLMGRLNPSLTSIREMLTRLKSGTYDFGLATCQTDATQNAAFKAQFQDGATAVKAMMNSYDASAKDLFKACGNEVPKLLALTADRIRQDVVFPLKTATATPKDFLRAYFADHAVYNFRTVVPAQKDLGTFSRSDFSAVTPTTRTLTLTSRPNFRGTGAYALPGRTVKVTRLDSGAVDTTLFVNTLRSGSTHEWDDASYNGYARPKFLWSAGMPIKPGQSITFTSPYGGPIEIGFNQKDIPVQFTFENVSEHPYWNGPEDDASFAAKLSANTHDWVEVATDGFEMHSKADRFKTGTLANAHWSTPAALATATQHFTYNTSHIIAGFQGDGIDKHPEVHGWATGKGLTVATTDVVKHMNADVPTCGWGCSGNPYDAGWAFSVVGHGDIHELGHSLQSSRWQLKHGAYSYPNHAGTNFYPYYVQTRFYDETGDVASSHTMPFKAIFNQLQAGYRAGDRVGAFSTTQETYFSNVLSAGGDAGIDNSYAFFFQFMMQVRKKGLLQNGWHMMGRLHIVDRAFRTALASQAAWDAAKGTFGFDQVTYAQAQAMTNNDFMAIAMSWTTGLDIRDYMAMWGFRISAVATTQIASYSLPAAERAFFALPDADFTNGVLTTRVDSYAKLPIDGTTAWPF